MRKRRLNGSLALSSIVASMFMIVIALSLGTVLAVWSATTFGASSGGSQLYFVQRQQALEEQFVIENVFLTKSLGYIDIFVRNVGASLLGVVAIYVDNIPETPTGLSDYLVTGSTVGSCKFPASSSTNPSGAFFLGTTSSPYVPPSSACNLPQTPPYPNMVDFNVQLANGFNPNCPTQPWCSGDIFYIVVTSGKGNQATYTVGAP